MVGVCKFEGCGKTGRIARGWCDKHYKRWQKHGDPAINLITTHGHSVGRKATPMLITWMSMRNRCKRDPSYRNRGIKVCERWDKFENFLEDMGEKPGPEYSIERKNNDGDYCPENCKWALPVEQANNTRQNRHIIYDGVTYTLMQFARLIDINYSTLRGRIKCGWDVHRIAEEPTGAYWSRKTGGVNI